MSSLLDLLHCPIGDFDDTSIEDNFEGLFDDLEGVDEVEEETKKLLGLSGGCLSMPTPLSSTSFHNHKETSITTSPSESSDKSVKAWGEWDVPMGRGADVRSHPGNVRYRDLIATHHQAYQNANKRIEKSLISSTIYKAVKSNGGRFLDKRVISENETIWYEISEDKALAKIGQALRMFIKRKVPQPQPQKTTATTEATTSNYDLSKPEEAPSASDIFQLEMSKIAALIESSPMPPVPDFSSS